jgi:outer membrane protein OmpA-like peptidoglycan-associated protein
MRALIPAAVFSLLGIYVVAFQGGLGLSQLDFAGLLPFGSWGGDKTAQSVEPVAGPTPATGARPDAPTAATAPSPALPFSTNPGVAPADGSLRIEFARVDAEGVSVIGGRAPPGSRVSLHANGEVVAVVTASDDGQWSAVVTRTFGAGPLGLTITSDSPRLVGVHSPMITLDVPKGSGRVELAAATPTARPILSQKPAGGDSRAVGEFAAMVERARTAGGRAEGQEVAYHPVVPVPITFVTGSAVMTGDGTRAADLLVEYVRIMRPAAITLSGHADVRGGDAYNVELSHQRLITIETFLRRHGYTGRLSLLAKGKSEPYQGIDRRTAAIGEIYQADRRVELRLAE